MLGIGPTEAIFLLVFSVFFIIIPFWKIFSRMGYNGALSLLMVISPVNAVILYYVAFAKWPMEKLQSPAPPAAPAS